MSSPSLVVELHDAVVLVGGFPLLAGVNLDIERATLSVITGANGAGKTSLLRLLGGLVPLSSGTGSASGVDLKSGDLRELRRRVGWLGHEGSFYDDLTVRENLSFAAKALGRPTDDITRVLERVGLSSRADTQAKRLSAGQRRRLGLAWLLLRRPEMWLLDEPYATLDDEGRTFFDQLIGDVVASGASVIVSAHDPLRSEALAPRTITLAGGLVADDQS
ncbi:MAG TPA: heme ABC exporter ATP-binding protein CcmA [Acidimicrobiales bacterium]|jgi:heme ABC exporter ATP-binding subunit CcmA|nr:heme ABC exporter ATP-binding protein CcmA [Acidimicrobiales bacterium]